MMRTRLVYNCRYGFGFQYEGGGWPVADGDWTTHDRCKVAKIQVRFKLLVAISLCLCCGNWVVVVVVCGNAHREGQRTLLHRDTSSETGPLDRLMDCSGEIV